MKTMGRRDHALKEWDQGGTMEGGKRDKSLSENVKKLLRPQMSFMKKIVTCCNIKIKH